MKSKKILSMLAVICLVLFGGIFLTACGGGNSLTINFESNGGTSCSSIEYTQDSALTMPNAPTKEDYLFGGWFEDNETFEKEFDQTNINSYLGNDSLTLYAKWLKKVNLVFLTNGGSECREMLLESLDNELPTPTKDGYVFAGWYLDNQTFSQPYTTTTIVEADEYNDVYLFAKWNVGSDITKTVYYISTKILLDKTSDTIEPNGELLLYEPGYIVGYDFEGWYYDPEFTQKAPLRIKNERITEDEITLYANFVSKTISKTSIVGNIKTEYEYGESFNANGAKLYIQYEDGSDDLVDITEDMVKKFYSTQEDIGRSYPNGSFNGETYEGRMRITPPSPPKPSTGGIIEIDPIVLSNIYVDYIVHTDLKDFTINQDNLSFYLNDKNVLNGRQITAYWTNKNDETGITLLYNDRDISVSQIFPVNCSVNEIDTSEYGTFTCNITFRFKTLSFQYRVESNDEILFGFVDSTYKKNYYLNEGGSLYENKIIFQTADGNQVPWLNFAEERIIEDVNTENSGINTAKVLYNGKEINVYYYVIDVNEIASAKIQREFDLNENVEDFTVIFTLNDGTIFIEYCSIYNQSDLPVQMLEDVDTTYIGTRTFKVLLLDKEIDVEYKVKMSSENGVGGTIFPLS